MKKTIAGLFLATLFSTAPVSGRHGTQDKPGIQSQIATQFEGPGQPPLCLPNDPKCRQRPAR
jgi:hypothetical protein